MSPDDIFAAQMWPWPDPLIKRDATGRILFLNAAFLGIYGGRVEDWQGNIVSGWPTPQGGATPTRFETRIPSAQGEIIYDWIEYTLADGHALAIARDVTAFATPPTPPAGLPESAAIAPQNQTIQAPVTQSEAVQNAQADQFQPAQQDVHYQTEQPHTDAPVLSAPQDQVANAPALTPSLGAAAIGAVAAPVAHNAMANMTSPETDMTPTQELAPLDSILDKGPQDFSESDTATPAVPEPTAQPEYSVVQEPAPITDEMPSSVPVSDIVENTPDDNADNNIGRDYERRALPIENDDAVLGNKWRDAVIAKAVGSTEEIEESSADGGQNNDETVPQDAPNEENSEAYRILLAEDNAINALLTRTLLEAEGCIVEVVEDGALAVEAVKNNVYDMIFMDMRMPNMDGLEATRKIRALDHRSKSLPIVALTANAFDDDRNACFDSGMNDFMTKPVSTEELSEMVKTWMKNRDQRLAS